jgi:hypothetical protein
MNNLLLTRTEVEVLDERTDGLLRSKHETRNATSGIGRLSDQK